MLLTIESQYFKKNIIKLDILSLLQASCDSSGSQHRILVFFLLYFQFLFHLGCSLGDVEGKDGKTCCGRAKGLGKRSARNGKEVSSGGGSTNHNFLLSLWAM